jgi:hypothetical protein
VDISSGEGRAGASLVALCPRGYSSLGRGQVTAAWPCAQALAASSIFDGGAVSGGAGFGERKHNIEDGGRAGGGFGWG